ncbi:MAG: prepilin peptidase [Campylobacterota bacterium]|nr:prepilin peptidase [Campylobacterota bacterium]
MLFSLSFYIFSLFLSYTDCTKFKIPNILIITLFIHLIIFGFLENQLNLYSFIISVTILVFFVIIMLIMPTMILGGGDIKYMMVIAIYISPLLFPLFLLLSGVFQMLFLLFMQKFKRRRIAPMAPAMFLAVAAAQMIHFLGFYL